MRADGPKHTDRIAIIGAGPAGLHMAAELERRGFRRPILLEQRDRIGGKSHTIHHRGVAHELGTCFLHLGYLEVYRLIQRYGARGAVGNPYLVFWDGPLDAPGPALLREFVVQGIGCERYIRLRRRVFGDVEHRLPPRPSAAMLDALAMPFGDFLEKHGLGELLVSMELCQTAQGYGYLREVSAFYGLWWMTPTFLRSQILGGVGHAMGGVLSDRTREALAVTRMLPDGFTDLWTRLAQAHRLDIRLGAEVRRIHRGEQQTTITYNQDGAERSLSCDFLIWAADLRAFPKVVTDTTAPEARLFDALEIFSIVCTLYESAPVPGYTDAETGGGVLYIQSRLSRESEGSWYSDRFDGRLPCKAVPGRHRQSRIAYQFFPRALTADERLDDASSRALLDRLRADWNDRGVTDIELVRRDGELVQQYWPYFPHFGPEDIRRGAPWELAGLQGTRRTWYAGAAASFESVNDVINHNLDLLGRSASRPRQGRLRAAAAVLSA